MKKLFLLILVVIVSGCAASGPVFSPLPASETRATVYIYRPKTVVNCCVSPELFVNEKK
ncbi:hypothetical protein ACCI51_11270 [Microbulbifer echini]|uniref:Lipoprotein n=2 Tax=Microbulbifer TaxID=48073 RepID=A0ABV4NQ91_9GAMM